MMTKGLAGSLVLGGRGQAGEEWEEGWQGLVGTELTVWVAAALSCCQCRGRAMRERLGALTAATVFPPPVSGRVANNSEELMLMETVTKTLHLAILDLHYFLKKGKKKKKNQNPKTKNQQQKTQTKPERT